MNKKGFTLVELLAVIVVLAVIAIIAVPQVLTTLEKARRGAAEKSALGYIEAIDVHNAKPLNNPDYVLYTDGEFDVDDLKLTYKGSKPTMGTVIIDQDTYVTKASLCINNYWVEYEHEEAKVMGKCNEMSYDSSNIYYNHSIYTNGKDVTVKEALDDLYNKL